MAKLMIPLSGLIYRPARPALKPNDFVGGFTPIASKRSVSQALGEVITELAPGTKVSFPDVVFEGYSAEEREKMSRAWARGKRPARPVVQGRPGRMMVVERPKNVTLTKAMLDKVPGLMVKLSAFARWRGECYLTEFTDRQITISDAPTAHDEKGIFWQRWAHNGDNWLSAKALAKGTPPGTIIV